MSFNKNFYQPNTKATREMAEKRMLETGFKSFSFKGSSFSNGASFYFTLTDGREVRVSDHPLTGNRAFNVLEVNLYPVKKLGLNR